MLFHDLIVASITGPYAAPVAVVRVSGEGAWKLAEEIFSKSVAQANQATFGKLLENGVPFDEGYMTLFEAGRSYTGDESFELSCHGNPAIVKRLINEAIRLGARPARPGEFTERAFLNGRIDLTQAEAVRETIEAKTEAQQKRAMSLRSGELQRKLLDIEFETAKILALAEASVDFSEEIGNLDPENTYAEIERLQSTIQDLLGTANSARIIKDGIRVAIVGRPNVGKSSLLNALLGDNRAIVTNIPGTTRDTIEESLVINGIVFVITDTAGIRESSDQIEKEGIDRSRKAIESADQVWLVYDASIGWSMEDDLLLNTIEKLPTIFVANKCDLITQIDHVQIRVDSILVSALTNEGIPLLCQHATDLILQNLTEKTLINTRHIEELQIANESLEHAKKTLSSDLPIDLVCIDLRGALEAIGHILGTTATSDILDRVFRDFCIGK